MLKLYLLATSDRVFRQVDKDMNAKGVQIHTNSALYNWLEAQPYGIKFVLFWILLALVGILCIYLVREANTTVQELDQIRTEKLQKDLEISRKNNK